MFHKKTYRKILIFFCILLIIKGLCRQEEKEKEVNCGVVALWHSARLVGIDLSLTSLQKEINKKEVSFYDLFILAQKMDFEPLLKK